MPVKEAPRCNQPIIICSKNSGLDRKANLFSTNSLVPIVVYSPHLPIYLEASGNEGILPTRLHFTPFEARQAGRLLGDIQERHANFRGATVSELAHAIGKGLRAVTPEDLTNFISGEYSKLGLSLKKIYRGASKVYTEEDPSMIALKNLANEQDALRTISQEGMTFGSSVRFLRLAQKLSQSQLAKISGLTKEQIYFYETDSEVPLGFNTNKIIKGLHLPDESKVGQLLHLKREKKDPMTIDKLQSCNAGELMRYMRFLKGFSEYEIANLTGKSQLEISKYERNVLTIPPDVLNKFIDWFTEGSNSTLIDVLGQKVNKPKQRISENNIQKILQEQYLFAEHIEQLEPYKPTTQDIGLMKQLKRLPTVGTMLQFIIDKTGIRKAEITRRAKISVSPLYSLQTGTPEDVIIVKIAEALGHEIYYPVAQFLLDRAERERLAKQQKRQTSKKPSELLKAS